MRLHPHALLAPLSSLLHRSRLNTDEEAKSHLVTPLGSRPDAPSPVCPHSSAPNPTPTKKSDSRNAQAILVSSRWLQCGTGRLWLLLMARNTRRENEHMANKHNRTFKPRRRKAAAQPPPIPCDPKWISEWHKTIIPDLVIKDLISWVFECISSAASSDAFNVYDLMVIPALGPLQIRDPPRHHIPSSALLTHPILYLAACFSL
ncbi:hypothetical protein P692DRAFT_20870503 [Suillus brevipes Sb2]|nr:hypothetical protein P692DRAFT_20870503 [Suillus brevipes Sb2]